MLRLTEGGEKISEKVFEGRRGKKGLKLLFTYNPKVTQMKSVLVKLFIAYRWSQVCFEYIGKQKRSNTSQDDQEWGLIHLQVQYHKKNVLCLGKRGEKKISEN